MTSDLKNIAILGSTGSIGCSTLDVVRASSERFRVVGITGHSNLELLAQQAVEFEPAVVVVSDDSQLSNFPLPVNVQTSVLAGQDGIIELATRDDVDVVVSAIVGSAGLQGTWAAIEAGKTIALANKETLVMAGPLVMQLASDRGISILPVDSEHSAIFQAMRGGRPSEVARVILTASGGPFRNHTLGQLEDVTVEEALSHPTWEMGPKITVDSATMMNKALEIIEARWLFGLSIDKIDVVIHPQSIVHSMVEFCDGSLLAQMSPPDMKLPIQYALSYPHRWAGPAAKLDLSEAFQCDFVPPDYERFPALLLGREVAERGGTCGAVLNAANESAVAGFLHGRLKFTQIVTACRDVLNHHEYDPNPDLERVIQIDRWAREEILRWKP
ncbi:MAG: 1-deoxy-D-xylulose-5-phosphate reductoisomerase [Planctomycetaceae bacterium]|nr:1-deoxy-D-xylulose-5-phosphate reductoisomerase [Planctomycetaceae bacterium]